MSANQLIAKALSTTSEDEAIACLRMARKKGLKADAPIDQERDEQWAQLVTQARTESQKYYRMLQEQINTTQKVKRDLRDAVNGQIFIAVSVFTIMSAFWLILFFLQK
jgi:hypothetical protein